MHAISQSQSCFHSDVTCGNPCLTPSLTISQGFSFVSPGPGRGTQIWKWHTSAYRRTKIRGVRCKISSKKRGSFGVGTKKNGGFFGVDSKKIKMGVIQCAKMQFQGKICKFSVKIATKSLNFSKWSAQKNCNFHVKFDTKVEKRGSLGVDWIKKGVIGCRIGIKKEVYWQALDIHRHMGVPPPPAPGMPRRAEKNLQPNAQRSNKHHFPISF